MFCPKCGLQLNDEAKFCAKCGVDLRVLLEECDLNTPEGNSTSSLFRADLRNGSRESAAEQRRRDYVMNEDSETASNSKAKKVVIALIIALIVGALVFCISKIHGNDNSYREDNIVADMMDDNEVADLVEPIILVVIKESKLHKSNSKESEEINHISSNHELTVVFEDAGFYRVADLEGEEIGWIEKDCVEEIVSYREYNYDGFKYNGEVETAYEKGIAIHTEPNIDAYTITRLKDGTKIDILAVIDEGEDPYGFIWCPRERMYGWINMDYVAEVY